MQRYATAAASFQTCSRFPLTKVIDGTNGRIKFGAWHTRSSSRLMATSVYPFGSGTARHRVQFSQGAETAGRLAGRRSCHYVQNLIYRETPSQ